MKLLSTQGRGQAVVGRIDVLEVLCTILVSVLFAVGVDGEKIFSTHVSRILVRNSRYAVLRGKVVVHLWK